MPIRRLFASPAMLALIALTVLGGCAIRRGGGNEMACMTRVIYFESHRSSREGMIAVGNVVMNRVRSDQFPNTVCGVVTQRRQFAEGVMTRKMNPRDLPAVEAAARAVLRGERHPRLRNAMYFHQAGLSFNYPNMHYVLVAGGNAFYERR